MKTLRKIVATRSGSSCEGIHENSPQENHLEKIKDTSPHHTKTRHHTSYSNAQQHTPVLGVDLLCDSPQIHGALDDVTVVALEAAELRGHWELKHSVLVALAEHLQAVLQSSYVSSQQPVLARPIFRIDTGHWK